MVPLELRRSDIGFGRVRVDDTGVTRERLWSSDALAWDEIRDYRLTIEIRGAQPEAAYLIGWLEVLLTLLDSRNGYRGNHQLRFGMLLIGDDREVKVNWRFRGAAIAIAKILARIHPRLAAPAHAELARTGLARFGPLTIGEHAIRWGDRPVVPRNAVESVELFNSYPIRLRVMARGKVWPYGQAALAQIPNVLAALEVAERAGYRVKGRELIARLTAA